MGTKVRFYFYLLEEPLNVKELEFLYHYTGYQMAFWWFGTKQG